MPPPTEISATYQVVTPCFCGGAGQRAEFRLPRIGARLGGTNPGRWTAYTLNWSRDGYVRFPPDGEGAG